MYPRLLDIPPQAATLHHRVEKSQAEGHRQARRARRRRVVLVSWSTTPGLWWSGVASLLLVFVSRSGSKCAQDGVNIVDTKQHEAQKLQKSEKLVPVGRTGPRLAHPSSNRGMFLARPPIGPARA